MKALIILENGFEDVEALCTYDILKRSGVELVKASLYELYVTTSYGHKINTDCLLKYIDMPEKEFDFLIIPGGKAVFNVLDKSKEIDELIDAFYNENKLIASICAAPLLIGKRGYFKDLEYTCFPGCEETIIAGNKVEDGVVTSANFITATSMYYSTLFALEIIRFMQGEKQREKVLNMIMGK